jgi:predicted O-methyltransferase YrrM
MFFKSSKPAAAPAPQPAAVPTPLVGTTMSVPVDYNPAVTLGSSSADPLPYDPLVVGASTIGAATLTIDQVKKALELYGILSPDAYTEFLCQWYEAGLAKGGVHWQYADIITALITLTETLRPCRYLEIGVRRGRSACSVGKYAPDCEMTLLDMWTNKNYAGMDNPGPDLVREELAKVGHKGKLQFVIGNSHELLAPHLKEHGAQGYDIITVDGDHTPDGATLDLNDVLPYVKVGGALVFDDISHPSHSYLKDVWNDVVASNPAFTSWTYGELGYGIAVGVRKRL